MALLCSANFTSLDTTSQQCLKPKSEEMRELVVSVRDEMRELEPKMRELEPEKRARAEVCVREREHWVCVGDRERESSEMSEIKRESSEM